VEEEKKAKKRTRSHATFYEWRCCFMNKKMKIKKGENQTKNLKKYERKTLYNAQKKMERELVNRVIRWHKERKREREKVVG
jgi:hypothetical protein